MCSQYVQCSNLPDNYQQQKADFVQSIVKDGGAYNGSKGFINIRKKDDGTRYPISVQEFKNPNNNSFHPTQKPTPLMEYLIRTYTNEGDTVFDGFMGSGTTGVACKRLNREFIGVELDEKYFKIAENRINEILL